MSVRSLIPELVEKARVELNEDPKRLQSDLQHIKDWALKQPHLRARTDDQWLLAFLRGCKFSLERTKEKLDLYYACRSTAQDFHGLKYNSPLVNEVLDMGAIIFDTKSRGSPVAPVVNIFRPGSYDPDKYSVVDVMAVAHLLQKIMLTEFDNVIVNGIVSIVDLEGVTMSHFLQMTPMNMKKMVVTGQDASPFRLKGTHYLNTPPGFETVFNAIKNLLNEKNRSRILVHNKNYEELYKHIPKDSLPSEYGGNAGSIREMTDFWKTKVHEYSSWLEEDEKYGTEESKRLGRPKTAEEMFGVEGSFRQLEFD